MIVVVKKTGRIRGNEERQARAEIPIVKPIRVLDYIPEPKTLMEMAKEALMGHLVEKPDGWYLCGRLSRLENIIPAANRNLKAWGLSQIGPSHWRV